MMTLLSDPITSQLRILELNLLSIDQTVSKDHILFQQTEMAYKFSDMLNQVIQKSKKKSKQSEINLWFLQN